MEHIDFYREVYLVVLGNERRDFRLVPDRAVYNKYLQYNRLPSSQRMQYRVDNPDLDDWMMRAKGYKKAAVTQAQKAANINVELDELLAEIERKITALR